MAKKPKTVPKVKSKTKPGGGVGGVDLTDVERLLAFMDKHGLEEFEYARGGVHIRLKKPGVATVSIPRVTMSPEPPYAPAEAPRAASHGAAAARSDLHVIKSPIVGTFYSSPSPGSDPVEYGEPLFGIRPSGKK
jgi:acetyl-CoA carboxylase biotin carboxyl carrier protein